MEMDALADFLIDNPPTIKRPEVVPHIPKSVQPSNHLTRPSISCANGHSQWYASRQHHSSSRIYGYQSCRISLRHYIIGKLTAETWTHQKSSRLYWL
jgi:hypothetical protein